MSAVSDAFIKAYGTPDPHIPCRLRYAQAWQHEVNDPLIAEIGSGHYRNGFFHLLGEDLEPLDALLDTWKFILPDEVPRTVIGRNAYGVLLVAEDLAEEDTAAQLCVLDPIRVGYHRDANWRVLNGLVTWLPGHYPNFMDDRIYSALAGNSNVRLEANEILAIKAPMSLGGLFEPDNFQRENIFDYYTTTAAIYAKYIANGTLVR